MFDLIRAIAPALRAYFAREASAPAFNTEVLEARCFLSSTRAVAIPATATYVSTAASRARARARATAVATPVVTVATPASTRASRARARARAAAATATPAAASAVTYAGPIVITKGGTYSGNWQSLDPNVPAVEIRTSQPVIIEDSNIRSRGTLIDATDGSDYAVNLTVRNTNGYGLNPNVKGVQGGRFLDVYGFSNILVENNYLQSTCGIYLEKYAGNHTASQTFKVLDNVAKDIDGRLSDGAGGYLSTPGDHYVQFFQTNGLQNMVGAEVAWNQVTNEPGKSLVEDNISIFDTTGTRSSRIAIHDNYIDGAYAIDPADETDYTGGGIMLSDIGSAYVSAFNNQVLDTTNYGIAISSGHDNAFYDNRIISSGELADGTEVAAQNVGAYIWNQNNESKFTNNVGYDNVIGWQQGSNRNDSWTPDAASFTGNTALPGTVTTSTTAAEWTAWLNKLAAASISVGPTQS